MQVDPISSQESLNVAEGATGQYVMKVAIQIEWGKEPHLGSVLRQLAFYQKNLSLQHQSYSKINFRCVQDRNIRNLKK